MHYDICVGIECEHKNKLFSKINANLDVCDKYIESDVQHN